MSTAQNTQESPSKLYAKQLLRTLVAVKKGDFSVRMPIDQTGLGGKIADELNDIIELNQRMAAELDRISTVVGKEGKIAQRATIGSAEGSWAASVNSVNTLITDLVQPTSETARVIRAVAKGDLSQTIALEIEDRPLKGEFLQTAQIVNTEQDWLKTNLAKFTRMLQDQRVLETVSKLILSELTPLVSAQHGVLFMMEAVEHDPFLKLLSTYACRERKNLGNKFNLGEGLVGQCALEKERILLTEVPDNYVKISSGLGESTPLNVVVLPVLFEGQVTAVIELASFRRFSEIHLTFLDQLTESIAIVLNTIAASMRTEELLKQS